MQTLKVDIYEKVSIAYADHTEMEQEWIVVEIFINALADAEMVQKLLEEQPRTPVRAYEIPHRFETTRSATRTVMQLMRPGTQRSATQVIRAATVWGNVHMLKYKPLERTLRLGFFIHQVSQPCPCFCTKPPCRMAGDKQTAVDQQVLQSPEAGLAQLSDSSWAVPIVMVKKKDQSTMVTMVMAYRPLNEYTIKDAYPPPHIKDSLDTLSTAKYLRTLDLTSG